MVSKSTLPALRLRALHVALGLALDEASKAAARNEPYNSGHEGYAVILEELDELFEDVRGNRPDGAAFEACQVAATALRFMTDVGPGQLSDEQPIAAGVWRPVTLEDVGMPGPWLVTNHGGYIAYCDTIGSTPEGLGGFTADAGLVAGARQTFWNVETVAPINRPGLTNFT